MSTAALAPCSLCEQPIAATDKVLPRKNEHGNVEFDHALCRAQKTINTLTVHARTLETFLGCLGALVVANGGAIHVRAADYAKSNEREHKLTAKPLDDGTGDVVISFSDSLIVPASRAQIEVVRS